MKTTLVKFQPETVDAINHLSKTCPGTLAEQEMKMGIVGAEPLLVILDACIRYAKAYEKANDRKIADDTFLHSDLSSIMTGARALLNCNGAVAMEKEGYSRDSKDNGTLETLFWEACKAGGYDGNDL